MPTRTAILIWCKDGSYDLEMRAKLGGMALLEMYDGDDRLIVGHGASGAPVIDCDGRVAAVVSNVFTQTLVWASREIKMSTAWGMPNVVSVPIRSLNDASPID